MISKEAEAWLLFHANGNVRISRFVELDEELIAAGFLSEGRPQVTRKGEEYLTRDEVVAEGELIYEYVEDKDLGKKLVDVWVGQFCIVDHINENLEPEMAGQHVQVIVRVIKEGE